MKGAHIYNLKVRWTGNKGLGTSSFRDFERAHTIEIDNKPDILGSADPYFRGDKTRHNPEELLLAAISSCHMMSYLYVCVKAGIIVTDYVDNATGTLVETTGGAGHFAEITLRPTIIITDSSKIEIAHELHREAGKLCFIANSVNFPILYDPIFIVEKQL